VDTHHPVDDPAQHLPVIRERRLAACGQLTTSPAVVCAGALTTLSTARLVVGGERLSDVPKDGSWEARYRRSLQQERELNEQWEVRTIGVCDPSGHRYTIRVVPPGKSADHPWLAGLADVVVNLLNRGVKSYRTDNVRWLVLLERRTGPLRRRQRLVFWGAGNPVEADQLVTTLRSQVASGQVVPDAQRR
jgi:hypothetical protein